MSTPSRVKKRCRGGVGWIFVGDGGWRMMVVVVVTAAQSHFQM